MRFTFSPSKFQLCPEFLRKDKFSSGFILYFSIICIMIQNCILRSLKNLTMNWMLPQSRFPLRSPFNGRRLAVILKIKSFNEFFCSARFRSEDFFPQMNGISWNCCFISFKVYFLQHEIYCLKIFSGLFKINWGMNKWLKMNKIHRENSKYCSRFRQQKLINCIVSKGLLVSGSASTVSTRLPFSIKLFIADTCFRIQKHHSTAHNDIKGA